MPQHPGERRNHVLDLMRGLAALLVCAGHLRAATMVDLALADSAGLVSTLLYALTGLGHQSVMVFFVLSGYLVGGSVMAAGPRFSWRTYAEARLSRLWTVLLPCLALTWMADQAILRMAPEVLSGAYAPLWHSAPQAGQYSASWPTLLGNVLFLQTIAVPVFGSNGPLWSLANEFWYYVLFPLLPMAAGAMGRPTLSRVMAVVTMAAIAASLPHELLWGYAIWLLGALAALIHRRHSWPSAPASTWGRWASTLLSALALAAAVGFSKMSTTPAGAIPWGDLALGLGVFYFVVSQRQHRGAWRPRPWLMAAVTRLSDISFSLYLSHFPIVMLLGTAGYTRGRMQPSAQSWATILLLLATLLLTGHLVWWLFERHTPAVRQMLMVRAGRAIRLPPGS